MIGDGVCDDGCNTEQLDFDQGDCCLSTVINFKCNLCRCYEHQNSKPTGICHENLLQDGICHDECNIEAFEYDHFDCCLESTADHSSCTDCICHLTQKVNLQSFCLALNIGDHFCNDECNNYLGKYDGGDCCTPHVDSYFCNTCACHNQYITTFIPECLSVYIGNGICEDECNTAESDFDDLDCCLPIIETMYCFDCKCHLDGTQHLSSKYQCSIVHLSALFITKGTCYNSNKIGNGMCDDDCNTVGTQYDGFDCCLDFILQRVAASTCDECTCHLDMMKHPKGCHFFEKGDGKCQDHCNYNEFEFDDLDCCLPYIQDRDCNYCICHLDGIRHLPGINDL